MTYVESLVKENLRLDGRKFDQYRDVTIELNQSNKAEGSAIVKMGKTHVVAGIKLALGEPYPDSPNKGNLIVSAEFVPFAHETF